MTTTSLFSRRGRLAGFVIIFLALCATVWNFNSLYGFRIKMNTSANSDSFNTKSRTNQMTKGSVDLSGIAAYSTQGWLPLEVNITALKYKVRDNPACAEVAADPKSYWRSQFLDGSLNTSDADIARMQIAIKCGILDKDYLTTPPVDIVYPFEKFYLSEQPLADVFDATSGTYSSVTLLNASLEFRVGQTAVFKIDVKDGRGRPKMKGGDQIRVWFEDKSSDAKMAAKVTDLNNGAYLASALLLWTGKLRLRVALAYPREYLRAVVHVHRVFKSFRPMAGVYINGLVSEATPCYHTPVLPGFTPSELCDLTKINGSPWFCGHPIKSQLSCSDYAGSILIGETKTYPVTDAEMEILNRSCRPKRMPAFGNRFELTVLPGNATTTPHILCNKVSPQATWAQEIPTGYMFKKQWFPRFCSLTKPDTSECFKNKQILLFGDSNARSHYEQIKIASKCLDIKKALTKKWHKPLLCFHNKNNFTVRWDPHANPFLHGSTLAGLGSLIPTANAIDEIPSTGQYLIVLNHYFHLTAFHISSIDYMFRSIKDALVRLFNRNPNVQVVLQGPHIAWFGWVEHYAAGDMFGEVIMDLEREIFHDIQDKVIYISTWDMTIATASTDLHPVSNKNIYDVIVGFTCGR